MNHIERPFITISLSGNKISTILALATEAMTETFGADDPEIVTMHRRVLDSQTEIDAFMIIQDYVDVIREGEGGDDQH